MRMETKKTAIEVLVLDGREGPCPRWNETPPTRGLLADEVDADVVEIRVVT
jgi:hypothetical protein